jgi:pyruvate/2-oxoacid:ferredoxin oxidoreductase beta subunit
MDHGGENMTIKVKEMPVEEYLLRGNAACPGCPLDIAMRAALKALGKNTIMAVPACCTSIIQSTYPNTAVNIPLLNIPFETTAAVCSGIEAGLEIVGEEGINVLGWAGDGGTYDIGIQALSGAAERNANFLYICYNNQMYSNTGIQRSGATPKGAWTTTTWTGKTEEKKNLPGIMVAHNIPYVATASISRPLDIYEKVVKAKSIKGTKYIEILAPCPSGWRFDLSKTVEVAKLAIQTRAWNLYEVENGRYKINVTVRSPKPITEYLKVQQRFKNVINDESKIEEIQREVDRNWKKLVKLTEMTQDERE